MRSFNALRLLLSVIAVAITGMPTFGQAVPEAGMLRYPDVSPKEIVFVYANDLWIVPREGGMARPLASPKGSELNPRFNSDGSKIAFVGNYDGGTDIYVTPAAGGIAERMTFHPASETLFDWSADGRLVYGTNGFAGLSRMTQLFTVSEEQPFPQSLPVPYGSNGTISEDGKWLAYTPYSRDGRTWKRYRGGMASDIWLFHLESKRSQQVTDWEGTDSLPMWHGQTLYFVSDAGPNHRLNLWKYDTNTKAKEQVTQHADFDVKWPSIGPGAGGEGEIVYQQGTSLQLLNLKSLESKAVAVTIPGDRPRLRKHKVDVARQISSASISPSGKRVAAEARGDIWSLATKSGRPQNLTQTSGVAERYPAWSPDGKWIAYFSDATDEYELMITQSDGRGETKRLTNDGAQWRYYPSWSPDSKLIVFTDKTGAILVHDIEAGTTKKVDQERGNNQPSVSWSHDSSWITYAKSDGKPGGNSAVWVYNVKEDKATQLTSGYFNDTSPAFDREGDFIYYQSNRNFNSVSYEDLGTTFIYENTGVLLALPLRADVKNPLLPKIDTVDWEEEADSEEGKTDKDEDDGDDDNAEDDSKEDAEETTSEAGNKDPISGTWTLTVDSVLIPEEARTVTLILDLSDDGELSGEIQGPDGESLGLSDAKFDADASEFSATVTTPMGEAKLQGSVGDGEMNGTVTISAIGLVADISATREGGSSGTKEETGEESDESAGKSKKKVKEQKPVEIEFEGAERRVIPLPVGAGSFSQLMVTANNQLVYQKRSDGKSGIKVFNINADSPKEQEITSGGGGFELSADGKKLLLVRGSSVTVTEPSPGKGAGKSVKTSGMDTYVEPREEWAQVFADAWRMQRDFFYDPTMHGVDWKGVRKQYEPLLKDATSRSDVGFIIGEMISELNVGHAYYRGIPDDTDTPPTDGATLGCSLEIHGGKYKIAEFWEGAVWDTDAQSPLRVAGAKAGQFILEIDGRAITGEENIYAVLTGLGGALVELTVSDDAEVDEEDSRVILKLPRNDSSHRFRHWIEQNRAMVDEASEGKIGYIYVTNTGIPGQNDLFRQFYAQMGKEALIIDDRWNGGGQIPTRFIELLNRPATNYWARRDSVDWRWPPDSHQGPKCMLINGLAGSGGDMFPALFRQAKLGKLIGRRTWGGLVGITGGPSLIDGASVTVPSFAYYELDGTWGIEGHGVDPDIEVIDDPALMQDGGDPQLQAAVEHLLEKLKTSGFKPPKRPAYPNRSEMGIPKSDQ